jgi:hypothetical protein
MTLATQRGIIITMANYHDRSSAEDGHFQKKKIKKIQNNSNHHLGKQEIQKRELH